MTRRLLATLLALGLSGCAVLDGSVPAEPPGTDTALHQDTPLIPSHWQAEGSLAAIRPHEAWSARFFWRQTAHHYGIELQDPFGQTAAHIEGTEEWVHIQRADGQTQVAGDPQALLAGELGWPLPVAALRYWLAGQPHPQLPLTSGLHDASGRWQRFDQAGWRIEYSAYHGGAIRHLPHRLRLEQEDLSVRIVITAWHL